MAGLVTGRRVYPTSGASWCRTRASPSSDAIKPHGLWFPVDISTASRATIGGMVGNNSCGARSLRYGNTRENVLSIDAIMADGLSGHFGPAARDLCDLPANSPVVPLARDLLGIAAANAREIETNVPKVQRRVCGYAGNG
jgi:FAD/FMN-containing dehydrogenase